MTGGADPREAVEAVRARAVPLAGVDDPNEPALDLIGDARTVLLGEASHGTHEFYRSRARLTLRLAAERGFRAVAIEGDWPDAWRINRHVRGLGSDTRAADALSGFRRFPRWMWRNTEVLAFVEALRELNAGRAPAERVGVYGLDLYSLHDSLDAVLAHLEHADPSVARRARERYACFDPYGHDTQRYGWLAGLGAGPSCEEGAVAMLVALRRRAAEAALGQGADPDAAFDAAQNALTVRNAERYYREAVLGEGSSWNLRDRHMAESLAALETHLGRGGASPKVVVWAHNSHLGDARATEMGQTRGELNLGQLVRESHGDAVVSIGYTTHRGTVTAAHDWDLPGRRMRVRPALPGSHEDVLHAAGIGDFFLPLRGAVPEALERPRLERAIGVVYRPATERLSHCFSAVLPRQFDAVLHFDETRAVTPLDPDEVWTDAEAPEAWPSGL